MYLVLHIKYTQKILHKFHFKSQDEDKDEKSLWLKDSMHERN